MTVKELRELLAAFPDDTLIVLGKDREGNGHSPCDGVDARRYRAENTWSGEIDHPEEPMPHGWGVPAAVLYPVN